MSRRLPVGRKFVRLFLERSFRARSSGSSVRRDLKIVWVSSHLMSGGRVVRSCPASWCAILDPAQDVQIQEARDWSTNEQLVEGFKIEL